MKLMIENKRFKGGDLTKNVVVPEGVEIILGEKEPQDKDLPKYGWDIFYHLYWHDQFQNQILESLTLPKSTKIIGEKAFEHCHALKSVNIPEGVTEIRFNAFLGDKSLKSIHLPSTIKSLQSFCLAGIPNLTIYYNGTPDDFAKIDAGQEWCEKGTKIIFGKKEDNFASQTLVIHPRDDSTVMLKEVYKDKGFDVIDDPDISVEELRYAIEKHDRIILLGHGNQGGLIHPDLMRYGGLRSPKSRFFIVDDSFADLLRKKETISMWCYSDCYFRRNNIPGFHSGMIISERDEALYILGFCPLSNQELFDNMIHLSKLLGDCINEPAEAMRKYILDHYVGDDEITMFNRQNIIVL